MRSLNEFATAMKAAKDARRLTATELAHRTGLSAQAVRHMLSGGTAPRLSNAMALAHELGYEFVLVPREVAQSLHQPPQAERTVVSDVERLIAGGASSATSKP